MHNYNYATRLYLPTIAIDRHKWADVGIAFPYVAIMYGLSVLATRV